MTPAQEHVINEINREMAESYPEVKYKLQAGKDTDGYTAVIIRVRYKSIRPELEQKFKRHAMGYFHPHWFDFRFYSDDYDTEKQVCIIVVK